MQLTVLTLEHDLDTLASEINAACWDEANDLADFDAKSLRRYLEREDTLFVSCHADPENKDNAGTRTLMGFASARIQIKPYENEKWLYIDEVDVCVDQRKKGAGSAIMEKLIELARNADCDEVWLGTEPDNDAANALYRSLAPADIEHFIGYTFKLSD